jgi:hypothetical protein
VAAVALLLALSFETAAAFLNEHYTDPLTIQIVCSHRTLTYTGENRVLAMTDLRADDLQAAGCPAEPAHVEQIRAEYDRWIGERRRRDSTLGGTYSIYRSHVPGNLTLIPWSPASRKRRLTVDH